LGTSQICNYTTSPKDKPISTPFAGSVIFLGQIRSAVQQLGVSLTQADLELTGDSFVQEQLNL
jgi:hypothetical protein